MYTNVKQHCNCQSQNDFSTLNITLTSYDPIKFIKSLQSKIKSYIKYDRASKQIVFVHLNCHLFDMLQSNPDFGHLWLLQQDWNKETVILIKFQAATTSSHSLPCDTFLEIIGEDKNWTCLQIICCILASCKREWMMINYTKYFKFEMLEYPKSVNSLNTIYIWWIKLWFHLVVTAFKLHFSTTVF